jgi:L-asparagine transporter-like permease
MTRSATIRESNRQYHEARKKEEDAIIYPYFYFIIWCFLLIVGIILLSEHDGTTKTIIGSVCIVLAAYPIIIKPLGKYLLKKIL